MDLADIHRQAAAAREFTEVIEGASFNLRLPTRLDSRIALTRVLSANPGETDNDVLALRVERESLRQAVFGWSDVPLRWVLGDVEPADATCAFDRTMVGLLLDESPDVADKLGHALFSRIKAFNATRDTAAKN